jgi:hypothetical protein
MARWPRFENAHNTVQDAEPSKEKPPLAHEESNAKKKPSDD